MPHAKGRVCTFKFHKSCNSGAIPHLRPPDFPSLGCLDHRFNGRPGRGRTHYNGIGIPGQGHVEQVCDRLEPLVLTAVTANNEEVTVITEVSNGDELMPEGAYIEVEIDFDEVLASLDPAQAKEVYLAAITDGGMDPATASSATDPVNAADVAAVLTEAEMTVAANYLTSAFQNRRTGRSDPAGPNTTRRESTAQAIGRAISDWIRNPSIPGINLHYRGREREYYPNGQLKRETPSELQIEVG